MDEMLLSLKDDESVLYKDNFLLLVDGIDKDKKSVKYMCKMPDVEKEELYRILPVIIDRYLDGRNETPSVFLLSNNTVFTFITFSGLLPSILKLDSFSFLKKYAVV